MPGPVTDPVRRSDNCLPEDIRRNAYNRLHWLWPVLARPRVRKTLRALVWATSILWFLFVLLVLALRFAVLPRIAEYRPQIEQTVSRAIGLPVSIARLEARWQGLHPDLVLDDVVISDRQGKPAFTLEHVEGVLSWQTLIRFRPTLALLAFDRPVLHVRRDAQGKITVAGIDAEGEGDPAFAEWVLEQRKIRVRDATVVWDDRLRQAPQLILEDLQLALDNSGRRHRFGISAAPPDELAARIDLRGEVRGSLGEALERLSGQIFVELDYADLAAWRAWVDYPVDLPQGRGALRLWGDLAEGSGKLTADVALEDVRIRLGRKLPELDLSSLRGRIEGRYATDAWRVAAQRLELQTRDGLRITPSDFMVDWRQAAGSDHVAGSASASLLDVAVLARLAAYVPLDSRSRELLLRHRPEGRISDLKASWSFDGEGLERYSLKAGFSDLGILAAGYFPGAQGLSGVIELSEKEGSLSVKSAKSSLSLPAVFPEPDIALDSLKIRATWRNLAEAIDVRLDRLEFAGPDASGSAQGTYRYKGDGPGEIDLTAAIDRAEGGAVWRYMPHVVNAEARAWVRRGIVGGKASEGRLVLKGDLRDFPFRDDKGGRFSVTAKATGAKIDYAAGWPAIDDVQAELSFGAGMKILATQGRLFGATLSNVSVEIPDFESTEEILTVRGVAQGPTAEFLRFIEKSPVADKIDRFTDGMQASGAGSLTLGLEIPLRHVEDTRLRGDYHFQNNTLMLLPDLPPQTQVSGRLSITESAIGGQDIVGRTLGGPFKVQVRSSGDKVAVQVSGQAAMSEVSKHFGWPLINHLTGSAPWRADIAVRRRNADVVIESDLVGVSSPLPEPLNKTASSVLPLRIERSTPDSSREQYRITLGKVGQGIVIRKGEQVERGVFAVGDVEPRLPERGLAIRVAAPRIDADLWRNFLPDGGAVGGGAGDAASGLPLALVSLKAPVVHLFDRDYSHVDVSLRPRDGGWQIGVATREAVGDVFWRGAGDGWVEGNFRRLTVSPASEAAEGGGGLLKTLPGMNLTVEDFRVGERALGHLDLKARNDKGAWVLETLSLQNPDGGLKGKGVWSQGARPNTRLDFELTAKDAGHLLERLGYADAVRRGSAKLAGDLQWAGPLTAIHYPSLTGQMTVEAEKGQFNKLDPGVGKLLGLISLQSLPRRLTLDFRDIFSDGLAFDSITGKLRVRRGVMRTVEPLKISGPAAQIEMVGEADLKAETQDLQVVVRPEVGGLAAVGAAALVNPVAGAAALVANTVLLKPLNRIFSYRYHVTGSWADPRVEKASGALPEPAPEPAVETEEKAQ